MQIKNHQLERIKFIPSPNFDSRPSEEISLVVIHAISLPVGNYDTSLIIDLFTNSLDTELHPSFRDLKTLKVSSHILITRLGEIIQFVSFNQRAWHAGVSIFNGREKCNDFSIGIELEGCDYEAFTSQQYYSLNKILKTIVKEYSIPHLNIVGHSDIAPGRKTDPGNFFEWERIKL
ncbi:MAG: 1,6-anhydro-N-acetylmuramyl-L-alanine amidase AmpD [Gammaproteobacteria bacterium]